MAVKAYMLIQTEVGKMEVVEGVQKVEGVKCADPVTGPYDIVATIEVPELDALGSVLKQVHSISGIGRSTTLIAMKF